MRNELIKISTKHRELDPLEPLLKGKPVAFVINDPQMRIKKRMNTKPVLFISPISMYGIEGNQLLVSIPCYGCEVISIEDIKPIYLYRVGLTMRASRILSKLLKKLFQTRRGN